MNRAIALAAACLLAGCASTSSPAEPAAAPPTTTAANPVDILGKIDGCEMEAGTELGSTDAYGERYASCQFQDLGQGQDGGTDITVRTTALSTPSPDDLRPDDSHKKIVGPGWMLTITGDWTGDDAYSKDVDPAEIATAVGGTVQQG